MAWEDFSDYVTHFTKSVPPRSDYDNQLSILFNGRIEARNAFGIARASAPPEESQKAVCFSEVPLHCLERIANRRSRYGIGFSKDFVKSKGVGPIWYVEKDSDQHKAISQLIERACSADDPIWSMTPMIDVPGDYPTGTYRFEWEREWRKIGDFVFEPHDAAFLVIPEELQGAAREFFRQAELDNSGPSFDCPFIDSSWSFEEINDVLLTSTA